MAMTTVEGEAVQLERIRTPNQLRRLDSRSSRYSTDERLPTYANSAPQVGSFDIARPRTWNTSVSAPFDKIYRQLLGLNPFKNTYLSLYDPLDTFTERAIAISGALFAVAAGVPLPVIGYIFGKIINSFPPPEDVLRERLIQLIGVAIAYFGATAVYTVAFGLTAENVSLRLRKRLLDCLLHLDQAYLDTHDIDVNGLLTEKMDTIQAGCSEKVGIFIQAMSYFVAAFIVGFLLDARLAGILLASVVPAISITFALLSPATSRCNRAASEQIEQANDIAESALTAVKVVQAFDMISEICHRHFEHLEKSTRFNVKKATFAALQSGLVYFVAYAANALAFYIGSRETSSGNAGTVYAVVFLILDASFVVGQFAPFLEIFARAASAKGVIQDLLDVRDKSPNSSTYRKTANKPNLHRQDVIFHQVEFKYPARPTVTTLDKIELTLSAGAFTTLVGTSGGGKSTMVALLLGIYDYSGKISIGDHDIKEIDSGYLRSQIAVVDQETVLLSGTVYDNICYGLISQDLSDTEKRERCMQAIKDANVDFLDQLPCGLETKLGNEVQLSGGQRQRVCLARALIKHPAILILDEPTSALDARSEVAVMEAIKNVTASGTTVIMIAHRLSTTLAADHIAVMSEGKVVEQGTPKDLSVEGTVFQSLLDAQNTNFDDSDDSSQDNELLTTKPMQQQNASQSCAPTSADALIDDQERPPQIGLWSLVSQIRHIIRPDRWIMVCGVIAASISGGIALGQAIVFGSLIELLNKQQGDTASYYSRADFFCLMFFLLALIALGSYGTSGTAFGVTSTRMTGRVQVRMLRKLLHADLTWFSETGHSTHRLMEAFTKDPNDLSALGGVALGAIFTIFFSIIGGICLALAIAWKIAVVLLAAVPVMLLAGYARLRLLTASETKHREAYSEATSLAAEACRNRRAVTALGLEQHLLEQYAHSLRQPYQQIRNFVYCANTLLAFCFSITYFVYALAYWWGSKQVRNGTYSTKDFFIVLPALLFSAQSAGQFFSLSPEIARAKTAARSIFKLLGSQSRIMHLEEDEQSAKKSSTASSLQHSTKSSGIVDAGVKPSKLEFCNVSLQYPNSSRTSLSDVSFAIDSGQTIALVGPSGAGKSSAVALIERFYDPSKGSVLYDGVDMREMNVRTLRSHMGLVSQDPDLFSGSIAYNVKLGAIPGTNVSQDEVEAVCKQCGLHDFVVSLPDAYNTDCGSSSSSRLSGGQRQRLAIARALVRNPDVLLLDEPTSALDAHSEAHVQAALAEAAKGRTTVMVAHRLASIRHVDKILVFDHGRVVAQGTHVELVEQGGLYASMAKAQSLV